MKRIVGLDTETYDPYLTERGPSWVFGEGYVICTSLYYEAKGMKKVVKGANEEVKALLMDPDVTLVGANILYDLGWLEYHFGMQGKTKCSFICVIIAETLLDEYDLKSLDHLSEKYLNRHKTKSELEAWCADQGLKGDFRKHLKDAPWPLVKAYAADDAELPVLVYRKQEPLLLAQELMKPFGIDCALIPIVNRMKQVGIRIDTEKRKKNYELMSRVSDDLTREFAATYGKVNFNSPKQIAALMDAQGVPYRVKFTINGRNGNKYGPDGLRKGKVEVSEFVKGFSISKKKLVCFVEKKYRAKMCSLLDAEGFSYSNNPNVDKKFLEAVADAYPVTRYIAAIKQVDGIISKFLGPNFDRFITKEGRVHCSFNISKSEDYGTISGRFSASMPNLQQIPSKGKIFAGTENEIDLAEICRELFLADEGCDLLKIDYSQIEYRLLVHYARGPGAQDAKNAFIADPNTDYHQFVMDLTGLARKFAKNCNFGIMYGMGPGGMMSAFAWTREHVDEILKKYHSALPYVKPTMKAVSKKAKNVGFIRTIGGRKARLRNKDLDYTMLNRLNQGGSADIMKTAMVDASTSGLFFTELGLVPHLTVHDELVCSVPRTEDGRKAVLALRYIMEHCIELKIPVVAEPEMGPDWFHVEKEEKSS